MPTHMQLVYINRQPCAPWGDTFRPPELASKPGPPRRLQPPSERSSWHSSGLTTPWPHTSTMGSTLFFFFVMACALSCLFVSTKRILIMSHPRLTIEVGMGFAGSTTQTQRMSAASVHIPCGIVGSAQTHGHGKADLNPRFATWLCSAALSN